MNPRPIPRPWRAALFLAALIPLEAAFVAGGTAYTKRYETKLLAEPRPLAEVAGKLGFGRKLKVEEVHGAWLRVSDGPTGGWVFAGNVSDTKPEEGQGLDMPLVASETSATAAARPLTPAAGNYAKSHQLANARADVEWLLTASAALTADEVDAYMQEHKKGEYQ
jgi:hypothetical protein